MNPWPFVFAAYALTGLSGLVLGVLSWRAMVVAERAADAVTRR